MSAYTYPNLHLISYNMLESQFAIRVQHSHKRPLETEEEEEEEEEKRKKKKKHQSQCNTWVYCELIWVYS